MNVVKTSTKKEKFAQIIEILETVGGNAELIACMNHEIELIDRKAENAKKAATKRKAKPDELIDVVKDALTDEFQTLADLVKKIDRADVTSSKISTRCATLVENGIAEKDSIKIPGEKGYKARVLVAYRLIG